MDRCGVWPPAETHHARYWAQQGTLLSLDVFAVSRSVTEWIMNSYVQQIFPEVNVKPFVWQLKSNQILCNRTIIWSAAATLLQNDQKTCLIPAGTIVVGLFFKKKLLKALEMLFWLWSSNAVFEIKEQVASSKYVNGHMTCLLPRCASGSRCLPQTCTKWNK